MEGLVVLATARVGAKFMMVIESIVGYMEKDIKCMM